MDVYLDRSTVGDADRIAAKTTLFAAFFVFRQVIDPIGAGPPQKPRAKRIHENRLRTGVYGRPEP